MAAAASAPRRPASLSRGAHVILRDCEGSQKVIFLTEKCKDVRMGKYSPIPVEALLASPYGATLRRNEAGEWQRHKPAPVVEASVVEEVTENNSELAQDNSAQALTPAEVSELKSRCGGEGVVEALASNSSTFASKTKFAQEKYLKKKQQKHVQQVKLLRPTVMDLCETYLKQSRAKVCGMRFDYLSSIVSQADVRSGGRYLVLDCASGLVVGAIAQRLSGHGRVFRVYRGGCSDKGVNELDLGDRRCTVKPIPLDVLLSEDPSSQEWLRMPPEQQEPSSGMDAQGEEERARQAARRARVQNRRDDVQDLMSTTVAVDAVVVVAGEDDADLATEVIDFGLSRLVSGGRLVVYGLNLQPLAARQGVLRNSGNYIDVRLHQLMTREYQVLPQRTHPIMTADALVTEGFILSATRVVDECSAEAAGEKRQRVEA